MAKIVLPDASNGNSGTQRINDNFRKVAEALNDKVLFRDNPPGEPNEMNNDLDMNSNRVYNLPTPVLDHEATPWGEVKGGVPAAKEWAEKAKESALEAAESADESAASALVATEQAERAEQEADRAEAAADSISGEIGRIEDLEEAVDQIEIDLDNKMDKNSLVLYADDFGAVGDGVANDQAALTAAFTAAQGRPVILTSGKNYRITSALNYVGDLHIRTSGVGKATISQPAQAFTLLTVGGTLVKTVNLNGDVQQNNMGWPVDDVSGITEGMLFEVKSSLSWYHDPRPGSSDARKSELHKVQRIVGTTVFSQDDANDGYDLTAETVELTFYSPIKVTIENVTFQAVLPAPATTTANITGLRVRYASEPLIRDVDCDSTAQQGILLDGCYRGLIQGGESRKCNNYLTGYGVHLFGCTHTVIRGRKAVMCRKHTDISGGNIISMHTLVEDCIVTGGGTNSRGNQYGWSDTGGLGDQQVGFATHGPSDHAIFRNNTLIRMYYGFGLISRNNIVEGNYFIGRSGVPVAVQGGENYWISRNKLYDGWSNLKNGEVLTGFADQRYYRPRLFVGCSLAWVGGRLYITDNDVQVQSALVEFAAGTQGARTTITGNNVEFAIPVDGTATYLINNTGTPESVTGWDVSDNNYTLKGTNGPVPALMNGITLSASSKLFDGSAYAGTYTPVLSPAVNGTAVISAQPCHYIRIGDIVQVNGSYTLTATTAGSISSVLITLPVDSTFGAVGQAFGVSSSQDGASGTVVAATPNRLRIFYTPATTTATVVSFTATYRVI